MNTVPPLLSKMAETATIILNEDLEDYTDFFDDNDMEEDLLSHNDQLCLQVSCVLYYTVSVTHP